MLNFYIILPVKYLSFTVIAGNACVDLYWVTDNITSNLQYDVDRSFDGNHFTKVAVAGDGFSGIGGTESFHFTDKGNTLQGNTMAWYRLKHMDGNGGFTYSNMLPVKLPAARGNGMQVSPNPFNEKITVLFISPQNSLGFISLRNAAGHPVLKQSVTIRRGQKGFTLRS